MKTISGIREWGSREQLLVAFGVLLLAFAAFVVMVQAWLSADGMLGANLRQRLGHHGQTMHQLERGLIEVSGSFQRFLADRGDASRALHEAQVDHWRAALSQYEAGIRDDEVLRQVALARVAAERYLGEVDHAIREPDAKSLAAAATALRSEAIELLRQAGAADLDDRRRALATMEKMRERAAKGILLCGSFVAFALLLIGLLTQAQSRRHEQAQRWLEDATRGMLAKAQRENEALTAELSTARRALHLSEQGSARKDAFFGVLGHELRNPLAPLANAHLLLDKVEPSSPGFARAKDIMGRQIRHLSRLVDDLLDVTRIANGKIAVHRTRLDLALLVQEVLHDHQDAITRHGIELAANIKDPPVIVDGDAARLRQVVGNLMGNAIKFTPAGGWIIVALDTTRDGCAELRVTDTGIGIDADLMPRLFDPFAQGAAQPGRPNTGLGLGLPLAKALVDLHGGRLQARSDGPRLGSEFVVHLPLAISRPEAGEPPVEHPMTPVAFPAGGRAEEPERRFFDAMRLAAGETRADHFPGAPRTAAKT